MGKKVEYNKNPVNSNSFHLLIFMNNQSMVMKFTTEVSFKILLIYFHIVWIRCLEQYKKNAFKCLKRNSMVC